MANENILVRTLGAIGSGLGWFRRAEHPVSRAIHWGIILLLSSYVIYIVLTKWSTEERIAILILLAVNVWGTISILCNLRRGSKSRSKSIR